MRRYVTGSRAMERATLRRRLLDLEVGIEDAVHDFGERLNDRTEEGRVAAAKAVVAKVTAAFIVSLLGQDGNNVSGCGGTYYDDIELEGRKIL